MEIAITIKAKDIHPFDGNIENAKCKIRRRIVSPITQTDNVRKELDELVGVVTENIMRMMK